MIDNDTDEIPMAAFIKAVGITMSSESTDHNPHMDDSDNMDNWKCVLRTPGKKMTLYFSKGIGHEGRRPTAAEVLDCLRSDASSVDNAHSFEDWASDFGYSEDSRKALRPSNSANGRPSSFANCWATRPTTN